MRGGPGAPAPVSWFFRRSWLVLTAAVGIGIGATVVWPGDPGGEALGLSHWVAVVGWAVAAALAVVGAVLVLLAIVGSTWGASDFRPNEYLDRD